MKAVCSNFTLPHNDYTYFSKEMDVESGLSNFGARLYDPWSGTWNSQDIVRGNIYQPETIHRYQYVRNNPINYADADGEFFCGFSDPLCLKTVSTVTYGILFGDDTPQEYSREVPMSSAGSTELRTKPIQIVSPQDPVSQSSTLTSTIGSQSRLSSTAHDAVDRNTSTSSVYGQYTPQHFFSLNGFTSEFIAQRGQQQLIAHSGGLLDVSDQVSSQQYTLSLVPFASNPFTATNAGSTTTQTLASVRQSITDATSAKPIDERTGKEEELEDSGILLIQPTIPREQPPNPFISEPALSRYLPRSEDTILSLVGYAILPGITLEDLYWEYAARFAIDVLNRPWTALLLQKANEGDGSAIISTETNEYRSLVALVKASVEYVKYMIERINDFEDDDFSPVDFNADAAEGKPKIEFTSGDLHTAIGGTENVTIKGPKTNGEWDFNIVIYDTYNFQFRGDFDLTDMINDLGFVGQSLGQLATYPIRILFSDRFTVTSQ